MYDRKHAMLTNADREYLEGKEYGSRRTKYDRRRSIRQGFEETMADFRRLLESDARDVFEIITFDGPEELLEAVEPITAFLHLLAWEHELRPADLIRRGEGRARGHVFDRVIGKLESGVGLAPADYALIVDHLKTDSEGFETVFDEREPPASAADRSQLVAALEERPLHQLWRPVLEAARLPYDEDQLAELRQRTKQATAD